MTVNDKLNSIARLIDVYNWSTIIAAILFIACLVVSIVLTVKMKPKAFFVTATIVLIVVFAALFGLDIREHSQYNGYTDQIKYFYQRTNIQPNTSENLKLKTFENKLIEIHNHDVKEIRKAQKQQAN